MGFLNDGWIGVDLDGTLAHYDGWKGIDHIGEPIPAMLERVKGWLAEGKDVRIFTARTADLTTFQQATKVIKAWCKKHVGKELPVTHLKDMKMIELWDDRAVSVGHNTGMPLNDFGQDSGERLEKLTSELQGGLELLEDFSSFGDLLSSDDRVCDLAKVRQVIGRALALSKISGLKVVDFPDNDALIVNSRSAKLVSIRPCNKKYGGKTYLGVYLGELATSTTLKTSEEAIGINFSRYNPAIYIPELGEIIYGYESFWGVIDDIENAKDITNEQIEGLWYVQAAKAMAEKKETS